VCYRPLSGPNDKLIENIKLLLVGNAVNTHGWMPTNNVEGMRLNMNVYKNK
jgi:hypothetical protein